MPKFASTILELMAMCHMAHVWPHLKQTYDVNNLDQLLAKQNTWKQDDWISNASFIDLEIILNFLAIIGTHPADDAGPPSNPDNMENQGWHQIRAFDLDKFERYHGQQQDMYKLFRKRKNYTIDESIRATKRPRAILPTIKKEQR